MGPKQIHDEGLINNSSVSNLSKQLYAHRNSIAHGKETFEDTDVLVSSARSLFIFQHFLQLLLIPFQQLQYVPFHLGDRKVGREEF